MKVIAVNNNKGGSLKTTTATNLAAVVAKEGHKVLIIDTDNQSNVALTFGVNPDKLEYGLYSVLNEGLDPSEAILNVYENIDLLPATDALLNFEWEVISKPKVYKRPFSIMKETCESLKERYDYVFIDTPPALSLMVGNVFAFADSVLIPFSPESYSMRSLVKVLEVITGYSHSFNPELKLLGIVPTMVNAQTTLHQFVLQETREYCEKNELQLYDTYIPRSIRFASSVAYEKLPVVLSKKANEIGQTYTELWKEIQEYER